MRSVAKLGSERGGGGTPASGCVGPTLCPPSVAGRAAACASGSRRAHMSAMQARSSVESELAAIASRGKASIVSCAASVPRRT
eukprot:scaffold132316_cov27-Tisochrysis_lutea.AAC.10